MKKNYLLLVPVLLCLCLAGCKDEAEPSPDSVVVSTAPLTVEAAAGFDSVTIFATCGWTATGDGWIAIDPASGERGIHAVTLTFGANETGAVRTGSVTFTAGSYSETFTLSQKAE